MNLARPLQPPDVSRQHLCRRQVRQLTAVLPPHYVPQALPAWVFRKSQHVATLTLVPVSVRREPEHCVCTAGERRDRVITVQEMTKPHCGAVLQHRRSYVMSVLPRQPVEGRFVH